FEAEIEISAVANGFTQQQPPFEALALKAICRRGDGLEQLVTRRQRGQRKWHGHCLAREHGAPRDRKSTRLNSSHVKISYAVFCFAHPIDPHSFPTRRSSDLSKLKSKSVPSPTVSRSSSRRSRRSR